MSAPMYRCRDIRQLHLEITTACNAACPLCLRNVLGGVTNPHMPQAELSLDDIRAMLPDAFVRQLDLIYLCGNYGDPMVARQTLDVLEHFRAVSPRTRLGVHTNGSGRQPEWWERLARVVDYCQFGIDGLEDTNHLYRRGTQWRRVMESVTAFIGAGGHAKWDFLVFRHNEHQIDDARALSQRLGFATFETKHTLRFIDPEDGHKLARIGVLDRRGQVEYFIQEPLNAAFQNESLSQLDRSLEGEDSYEAYLDTTAISCKVAETHKLYLSAEGLAFPCCWMANLYPWYPSVAPSGVQLLIDSLPEGKRSLDARVQPLEAIVDGPFFQQLVPASWDRPSVSAGRLEVCARTCGTFDLCAAQRRPEVPEFRSS